MYIRYMYQSFLEGALKRSEETKVEWEKKLCKIVVSVETCFNFIQERSFYTKITQQNLILR